MGFDDYKVDHTDAPEVFIEGEGAPATSTLAPTSTFKLVGAYTVPPRTTATSTAIDIGFIVVTHMILQSLVEW